MKGSSRILAIAAMAAMVSGCATTLSGSPSYDPNASRAYNLAQAGGLYKVQDTKLGESDYNAAMDTLGSATSSGLLFNSSAGLGLDLEDALGLGLVSAMLDAPDQTQRDSAFAWVPASEAATSEEAQEYLLAEFVKASKATIEGLGMTYDMRDHEVRHDSAYGRIGTGALIVSEEMGCKSREEAASNSEVCVIGLDVPEPRYEPSPAPAVADVSGPAYAFPATNHKRYIRYVIASPDEAALPKERITSMISEAMPNGFYIYLAPTEDTPPMVFDQGEPLLFISREA